MMKQEDSASDRIGLSPKHLLVPVDLRATAITVMDSVNAPGSGDNDVNPYRNWCDVIVVPGWTDENDWALAADPAVTESIVLCSFRGNRAPELFVADEATVGSMFTNDEMRIKVRFFVAVGVPDWRGLFKANVA